jgi:hypothetical protein
VGHRTSWDEKVFPKVFPWLENPTNNVEIMKL